ncbi:MAG: CatB-related O-acetyltransferase [Dysgonamonadaceae bacterium]|jgi:virginiamycin A acetyltransferase|nr:CatB-related O-acetyltransferase [Dysgonamonadaceae bacterium]
MSNKIDFPDARERHPIEWWKNTCFLKNCITRQNIEVGDYTYFDDMDGAPQDFETKNVKYHYEVWGDKLRIGKFCQIASGVKFLMNGMFHNQQNFTTFPFTIFSKALAERYPVKEYYPYKGDIVVGNDVWIGYNVTVMAGVSIGDGAIIGTNSLVTKDVEPYTIVGGNPATFIRKRFPDEVIEALEKIRWWDWDIEKILQNIDELFSNDIARLKKLT